MLGYFPEPGQDELLYSLLARLVDYMRYPSDSAVVHQIFGTSLPKAVVDLPGQLGDLVRALPEGHPFTISDFIDHHTLLPYYAPFLPAERYTTIRSGMINARKSGVHLSLGVVASGIQRPSFLRYCPVCVLQDRERLGEAYWHRTHQVPGVLVCPVHSVWLEDSHIRIGQSSYFHSAEKSLLAQSARSLDPENPVQLDLLALAQNSAWLLENPLQSDFPNLRPRYLTALVEQELATLTGSVRIVQLIDAFRQRYTSDFLDRLGCELDGRHPRNWLARIAQSNQPQPAIRHLLVIHFLGYTVEQFFQIPIDAPPFGEPPWLCLNPVCPHFQQPHITDFKLGYSRRVPRKPLGTFTCSCGFRYNRTGPDRSPADRYRFSKVVDYGALWETRLRELWAMTGLTQREKAARLGIHLETLKHHAARLGLLPIIDLSDAPKVSEAPADNPSQMPALREQWAAARAARPNASLAELRDDLGTVYKTLYRLDYAWLRQHRPSGRKPPNAPKRRVDWPSRDAHLSLQAVLAAQRLRQPARKPVRLTINAMGIEMGLKDGSLQRDLARLPRTRQTLQPFLETHEAFALRRIDWITRQYVEEHVIPTRWQLRKRSGLSPSICTPAVNLALDRAVQWLRSTLVPPDIMKKE